MAHNYVAMWDRAEGNANVGTAWTETKVFGPEATLQDVFNWVEAKKTRHSHSANLEYENVRLAVAQ
ncbi:MAG: hypothetical protein QNJ62_04950 [Methyloceanibacter sp.]|nr:hypothetical protein [Methyloceanibacter sp.]